MSYNHIVMGREGERFNRVISTAKGDVTLGCYVRAWQSVLASPVGAMFKHCLQGHFPERREEILRQFTYGTNDRINAKLPWWNKGRKWGDVWQTETLRAAVALNQPRLRIYWLPEWLKARFNHRLSNQND